MIGHSGSQDFSGNEDVLSCPEMASSDKDKGLEKELRRFLNDLSQDLEHSNLKHMKFLLHGHIPEAKLEKMESGLDLFDMLLNNEKFSWQLLKDLMELIRREDLRKRVKDFAAVFEVPTGHQFLNTTLCEPCALRKLLYKMAEDMDSEMVENIKYLENLSRRTDIKDGLDLLDHFVKDKPINDINELPEKLKDTDLLKLYERHSKTSFQYRLRLNSLLTSENDPTFPEEYLPIEDWSLVGDCETGTFGVQAGSYRNREVVIKSHNPKTISEKDLKMTVYLRHPFLLSIIRSEFNQNGIRMIYCIKAKMDLANFLTCKTISDSKRDAQQKRVKILYQVSDVLRFLHSPVPCIRGSVIHMNVKPHNIFLDSRDNALLGDIDTAVEIQEDATHRSIEGTEAEGYTDWYKRDKRKQPSNDIFSFGIVALQVLKWQPASTKLQKWKLFDSISEQVSQKLMKKIDEVTKDQLENMSLTKDFVDEMIWNADDETFQTVGKMAIKCLLSPGNRITAPQCAAILKDTLDIEYHGRLWETDETDRRCIQCHFSDINDRLKVKSEECTNECIFYNKFCKDCHYYSFRSPLHCPSHGVVYPMIGSRRNFALLICGYDHESFQYKAFQKDVDYVKRVITDPRVMNIRLQNLIEVREGEIKNTADLENVLKRFDGPVEFLFVYYSGHDVKDGKIKVTEKAEDVIDIKKLRELLGQIQFERLLVLFDCCFAAAVDLSPVPMPECCNWMTILYSSNEKYSAECNTKHGSVFTRYFLAGLQSSRTCVCQEKDEREDKSGLCSALNDFRTNAAKTGFIEFDNLIHYIHAPQHEPVNQKPRLHAQLKRDCTDNSAMVIAYYNEDVVAYNFLYSDPSCTSEVPIQLEQIDHSASTLEKAVLERLCKEITKYAPSANKTTASNLRLKSEHGNEVTTVDCFKKLAMRNECFRAYLKA